MTKAMTCGTRCSFNVRRGARAVSAVLGALFMASCGQSLGNPGISLVSVPTPAHLLSGGDALLRVDLASDAASLVIRVNGDDRTRSFHPAPADRLGRPRTALLGLVEGLPEGQSSVVLELDGKEIASLELTLYPITGPVFSGKHLEPYFCLDELAPQEDGSPLRFALGNGELLDTSNMNDDCSLPKRVDYLYQPESGERFEALEDLSQLPADIAATVTSEGESVPFIVRLETGTINRAIYQIATLVDPETPEPDLWAPYRGWNGRLVYTYGGGCEAGFFQGHRTGGVLRQDLLGKGYAVASSTLNVNAQGGCNDPLSAETTMMVKEHFAETFGPPLFTLGSGGSGGAMQQLLIAGAYPGILDGLMLSNTFPDAVTYFIDTAECRLPLRRYLNSHELDDETKRVIGGWALWSTCERSLGSRPDRIGPDDCPRQIPETAAYDPVDNPTGVRCSIYDGMRNVFGTAHYDAIEPAPVREFGRSPHDNIGVQYGLVALNEGLIDKRLFLDLNENVGGWDIDFNWRPERARGDLEAIRIAYESGRVTNGLSGLATIPIVDDRVYLDKTGNFHTSYYSFVTRARLLRDTGTTDNYVLRRGSRSSLPDDTLERLDAWLVAIALDNEPADAATRVARNRPPGLTDACYDDAGQEIAEPQSFDEERLLANDQGRCNELYPPHTGPRMVAGGPLTNDVLKCQLKPLDRADYTVSFDDAEWARLESIFPEGVCDWSQPGIGQPELVKTWLSYGPSPVNRFR